MEAVEAEVSARERISVNPSHPPTRRNEFKPPPSATSLVSSGMSSVNTPCCYCKQLHWPSNCSVVSQVEARKQALHRSGQCFSCLRKGHLSRDCHSQGRCHTCKGRYHSSICSNPAERESDARQTPQHPSTGNGATLNVTNSPATQLNPDAPVYTATPPVNSSGPTVQPPTTLSLYAGSSKTVLLQTAVAEVVNPRDPSHTLKVGIVFDGRSQKSYLTQRVKDVLALPVDSKQYLSIAAFSSRKGRPKQCEVVHLIVQTKLGGSQELKVFWYLTFATQ